MRVSRICEPPGPREARPDDGLRGVFAVAPRSNVRAQIIWDKGRRIVSRCLYHWRHEAWRYAERKLKTANGRGDRKQTAV